MLWARLVSDTVRALDPGVNSGAYTPEELQDFNEQPQPERPKRQPESRDDAKAKAAAMFTDADNKAKVVEMEAECSPILDDSVFETMPVGKLKGKLWGDMTVDQLKKVLITEHPAITQEHKERAKLALARKEG
jgi:hypothetical protein